jgi:hypothetical protein
MDMTNRKTRRYDNRGLGTKCPTQRERNDLGVMGQTLAVAFQHLSHPAPRTGIGTGSAYAPAEDFGMVPCAPRAGRLVGPAGVLGLCHATRARCTRNAWQAILSRWSS